MQTGREVDIKKGTLEKMTFMIAPKSEERSSKSMIISFLCGPYTGWRNLLLSLLDFSLSNLRYTQKHKDLFPVFT